MRLEVNNLNESERRRLVDLVLRNFPFSNVKKSTPTKPKTQENQELLYGQKLGTQSGEINQFIKTFLEKNKKKQIKPEDIFKGMGEKYPLSRIKAHLKYLSANPAFPHKDRLSL